MEFASHWMRFFCWSIQDQNLCEVGGAMLFGWKNTHACHPETGTGTGVEAFTGHMVHETQASWWGPKNAAWST